MFSSKIKVKFDKTKLKPSPSVYIFGVIFSVVLMRVCVDIADFGLLSVNLSDTCGAFFNFLKDSVWSKVLCVFVGFLMSYATYILNYCVCED